MQILGAIFGALIYAALIPQLHIGGGDSSPGCFGPSSGTTWSEVFGWETMMTFFLVMTVYASAVAKVSGSAEGVEAVREGVQGGRG